MSSFKRAVAVPSARAAETNSLSTDGVALQPSSTARAPQAVQLVAAQSIPGTRKWLDGSLLTSSGHSVIDKILGGGYQSGSLVLIEEDVSGVHARSLAQLFVAEGLACGHKVVLAGHDGRVHAPDLLPSLPLNVSKGSRDMLTLAATAELQAKGGAAGTDEGEGEDMSQQEGAADPTGAGLQNAWQYKKYLSGTTAGSGGGGGGASAVVDIGQAVVKYGHTYDLGRKVPGSIVSEALQSGQVIALPPVSSVWSGSGLPYLQNLPVTTPPTSQATDSLGRVSKRQTGPRSSSGSHSVEFMDALIELQSDLDPGDPEMDPAASRVEDVRKQAVRQGVAGMLKHVRSHAVEDAGAPTGPVSTIIKSSASSPVYDKLMRTLQPHVGGPQGGDQGHGQATLTRLVVLGVGGPQWDGTYRPLDHPGLEPGTRRPVLREEVLQAYSPLLTALQQLRAMVETASQPAQHGAQRPPGVVAFITVPTWLLPIPIAERVRACATVVLKVHAFGEPGYALSTAQGVVTSSTAASTGTAPEFAEYTGLLLVRKSGRLTKGSSTGGVPSQGSTGIGLGMPEAKTWLFKRDKRKLTIELPHLPPEGPGGPPPPTVAAQSSKLQSSDAVQGVGAGAGAGANPLSASLAAGKSQVGLVQLQVKRGATEPLDYDEEPTELDPVLEASVASLGVEGGAEQGGGGVAAGKAAMACASATAGKGGALDF